MFQVYNNLPQPIFNDVFIRQENIYNFRRNRVSNTNWKSSSVELHGTTWNYINTWNYNTCSSYYSSMVNGN